MTERELVERGLLEDDVRACEQHCAELERELAEARTRAEALEYASGYEADLVTIRRVLDEMDAPHDCEEGVSLEPRRIRLLAEQRDEARAQLACAVPIAELRHLVGLCEAYARGDGDVTRDVIDALREFVAIVERRAQGGEHG